MSERYTKLFTLPENLYTEGAPVVVSAGALLKDNQTGKVLAQLKIKNITNKAIKAAKIRITPFDTVENPLDEELEHEHLDLNVQRDDEFGQKAPIIFANASTRSFSVCVNEVIFSDNSIWNYNGGEWYSLSVQESLEKVLNDDRQLVKQYKIEYGKQCKFGVVEDRDLWLCSCGNINHNNEGTCHKCGCELETLKSVDIAELEEKKNARLAEEKRRSNEAAAVAKAKAKRTTKIVAIVLPIVVVLIIAGQAIISYVTASPYEKLSDYISENGEEISKKFFNGKFVTTELKGNDYEYFCGIKEDGNDAIYSVVRYVGTQTDIDIYIVMCISDNNVTYELFIDNNIVVGSIDPDVYSTDDEVTPKQVYYIENGKKAEYRLSEYDYNNILNEYTEVTSIHIKYAIQLFNKTLNEIKAGVTISDFGFNSIV